MFSGPRHLLMCVERAFMLGNWSLVYASLCEAWWHRMAVVGMDPACLLVSPGCHKGGV